MEYIVGNLNEIYQFRILGDARMEGTNAVYRVELAGGNEDGVPKNRLLQGELFSVEAAFVEGEMSREVGTTRYASSVKMRNEFSHVRIKEKVPGNKLNKKLAIGVPVILNNKRTTTNIWMHIVDYAVETQFSDYKNNAMAFGRSNRNSNGEYTNIGKSGSAIKTGAGLFEQLEVANTIYYNTFSLKLIEEALYDLSYGELDIKDRVFVMKTGQMGAMQFHKAIMSEVSGWNMFALNGDALGVVQKVNSPLHNNALRAGFQFVEYLAPMGITLKLDVDPCYDDPVRNKIQHPHGGPAFSYRYDIMEIGSAEQPNIQKCVVENEPEYRGLRNAAYPQLVVLFKSDKIGKNLSKNFDYSKILSIFALELTTYIMEEFRVLKDFDNYKISNLGRIYSIKRRACLKVKKLGNSGYYQVRLFKDGSYIYKNLHRLIAETFISNPNNYRTVNHINGNKLDNRVDNLEWASDE